VSESLPPRRKPYSPPRVEEILLDANEAMLTPCKSQVVTSPPCPPPLFSVVPVK
jgi:hypothetical protein